MGKTSKWLKSFLTGKKDKENKATQNDTAQPRTTVVSSAPKEKRRWSFRRSSATAAPASTTPASTTATVAPAVANSVTADAAEIEQKKNAMAVAAATAAAAEAAVTAALTASAAIRLTGGADSGGTGSVEEAAAIKIQSVFRSYLARKALNALRGLVKLQALVRGHLVRKQAKDTLRCMQALVTAQARARAHRIRMVLSSEEEEKLNNNQRYSTHSRKAHEDNLFFRHIYDHEMNMKLEENIKIVEMDVCETKGEYRRSRRSNDHRISTHSTKEESYKYYKVVSPAQSGLTDISPRAHSGHFEDNSTAQSSPQYYYSSRPEYDSKSLPFVFPRPPLAYAESIVSSYDYPLYPNYMANTESSRAKARSQSAPKQRPADSFERQPSRRRASVEGRNVPRPVRMQRSASHVGAAAQNYHYPCSIKLDKSSASLKDSECGSTSTVLTNTNFCNSLVAHDAHHGERYY